MIDHYSGIGSRNTPLEILALMTRLAYMLESDYILRSGGADGSDLAFEKGVLNGNKEIYLPWQGFNNSSSEFYEVCERAKQIAKKYHPANWDGLRPTVQKLHARNVYQVLGYDLDTPSKFVLCWTPDYCESHDTRSIHTGGTGTAISVASHYNVPVINMSRKEWPEKLMKLL